jgi:hypothetical protein
MRHPNQGRGTWVPKKLRTICTQVYMLREEPVEFLAGQYMLVARVRDTHNRVMECWMLHVPGQGWIRLSSEDFTKRFQQLPPQDVSTDTVGLCEPTEDIELHAMAGMWYDRHTYNVAMDELTHMILRATRNPHKSRERKVSRGRSHIGIEHLRKVITPAPQLTEEELANALPTVSTKALRNLLVEKGLRPDLAKA